MCSGSCRLRCGNNIFNTLLQNGVDDVDDIDIWASRLGINICFLVRVLVKI